MKKNHIKTLYFIFAILFGIFTFVFGGYDDSPGAQLIGFIAVVVGITGLIKNKKRF
jgi:hypothetical protein